MLDDPLIPYESRQKFGKSCIIPTIVAIIFALLFLVAGIGVIVLASRSTSTSNSHEDHESSSEVKPIEFDEYTADTISLVVDTYGMHQVIGQRSIFYAYGSKGSALDMLDNTGSVYIRQYSFGNGSIVACQTVGNHNNCFSVSGSFGLGFTTKGMRLIAKGQPCSSIIPNLISLLPNRSLDKCDCYSGSTDELPELLSDMTYQLVVESENGYPVVEMIKFFQTAYAKAQLFLSFKPGKPSTEEPLKPFENTTIYDYTDHEGDCSEEKTFKTSENPNNDLIMKQLQRQSLIRHFLHMPPIDGVSSTNDPYDNDNDARDVRDIPAEFDARTQWASCAGVIGHIMNQNPCSCCWAMSSSAVLSDRMCIEHNSTVILSPQYMVYCGKETYGCQFETTLIPVWDQLVNQGTVSDDCVPFTARNGVCPSTCRNGTDITPDMFVNAKSYSFPWDMDPQKRVQIIQTEIMEHGSVQATFQVFSDFVNYDSGVYHRTKAGTRVGGHAVRIIGWGTEDNVDYWLVANSWSEAWGIGGFFKIQRGNNECNIEEIVVAPQVN